MSDNRDLVTVMDGKTDVLQRRFSLPAVGEADLAELKRLHWPRRGDDFRRIGDRRLIFQKSAKIFNIQAIFHEIDDSVRQLQEHPRGADRSGSQYGECPNIYTFLD